MKEKIKHYLLAGVVFLFSISLLFFGGLYLLERPNYIVLSIPSPISYTVRGDWSFIEYDVRKYIDSGERFFIYRQKTNAYGSWNEYQFNSWSGVVSYFDSWLLKHGWVRDNEFESCAVYVPEIELLPQSESGYVAYRRSKSSDGNIIRPLVCLAVWEDYRSNDNLYYVVLVTINPSFLTYLRYPD